MADIAASFGAPPPPSSWLDHFDLGVLEVEVRGCRNIDAIHLDVPDGARLVCLVGDNGTGKSNVLQVIGSLVHRLGLSDAVELRRGDPVATASLARAVYRVTNEPDALASFVPNGPAALAGWDGTLEVRFENGGGPALEAAGAADPAGAHQVMNLMRASDELHYLYLDADRSYAGTFQTHELGDAVARDWESLADRRTWAFRMATNLYGDWLRYMVGREVRAATDHTQALRAARASEMPEPTFTDPNSDYADSLREILPHLHYLGAGAEPGAPYGPKFDSAGTRVGFDDLSGGERELAFLLGQVDRFRLRQGLFLVDEPELHLNPALLRTWLDFLQRRIARGQVWIATHALEAVEVAGREATFMAERDVESRRVVGGRSLADAPVIATLSATLGSPAFSIQDRRFVLVEAERGSSERQRFEALTECPDAAFVAAGGADQVRASVLALGSVASAEPTLAFSVGGIVDRDFKTPDAVSRLEKAGLHVLGVHEIENLFLEPGLVGELAAQAGTAHDAAGLTRAASDARAGAWVYARTVAALELEGVQLAKDEYRDLRSHLARAAWPVEVPGDDFWGRISSNEAECRRAVTDAVAEYARLRDEVGLWRLCLGKETWRELVKPLGLQHERDLDSRAFVLLRAGFGQCAERKAIRDYVLALVGPA